MNNIKSKVTEYKCHSL